LLLADKRVVITGAGRGIGRAIALACAREGAVVGINYHRSREGAEALRVEIEALPGPRPRLLRFDVSDPSAVAANVAAFVAEEGRVDGWVNNAAVNLPGLLATAEDDQIRAQIEVNLLGPIHGARAVIPVMMRQRGGVILNIGSVVAARPSRGQAVYAATKGALESLTRAIAVEYGRKGVRALCLCPGAIDTEMLASVKALAEGEILGRIPLRRLAEPAEVAEVAVFLLSDGTRYLTHSTHSVDGDYQIA